jgi:hypothetical protein
LLKIFFRNCITFIDPADPDDSSPLVTVLLLGNLYHTSATSKADSMTLPTAEPVFPGGEFGMLVPGESRSSLVTNLPNVIVCNFISNSFLNKF